MGRPRSMDLRARALVAVDGGEPRGVHQRPAAQPHPLAIGFDLDLEAVRHGPGRQEADVKGA